MIAHTEAGYPATNMLIGDARRRGRAAFVSIGPARYDPDPIGTAFFLDVPWGPGMRLTYAVTARHCVEGLDETIYIEGTDIEGKYQKIATTAKKWIRSKATDLACLLLENKDSRFFAVDINKDLATGNIPCGMDVYMIGLFTKSSRRYEVDGSSSIEPVVRFGKISLPATKVAVHFDPKDANDPPKAHIVSARLVECISFEGESGSPVFMYQEHMQDPSPAEMEKLIGGIYPSPMPPRPRPILITDEDVYTPLIGLLSSHWKVKSKVHGSSQRKKNSGEVGLNSGIAIVIPAEDIRDFIMNDDKVKKERERIPQGKPMEPSSPLSARRERNPEGEFTKEDFENALKKASRKIDPKG